MELFMDLSPIAINTSCPFGRKYFQDPTGQRSKQHLPNNSPLHSLHIFLTCQVNKKVHFLLINIVLPLGMIGIVRLQFQKAAGLGNSLLVLLGCLLSDRI